MSYHKTYVCRKCSMLEWYRQGKTKVLGEKEPFIWLLTDPVLNSIYNNNNNNNNLVKELPQNLRVVNGAYWNDTDRGKPQHSEKNPSQCRSVHHKSHTLTSDRTQDS